MVRLLPRWRRSWKLVAVVSIPQWCDCCPIPRSPLQLQHLGFNPTMVRLLPPTYLRREKLQTCFNPTMVRLLRRKCRLLVYGSYSFNPTMVRLLRVLPPNSWRKINLFQSHNGAIAACGMPRKGQVKKGFNPTMVRLLRSMASGAKSTSLRFNPTMVRLLLR